ncbi:MAG: exo-alpha-sialidase [Bryobacterales bacterium]|nr:exo-alpha-sialidase [Bryobacterales bacterium]
MKLLSAALVLAAWTLPAPAAEVLSNRKIWDQGAHNAFTDLVRHNGRWYCTFREGTAHARENGRIRVIESADGERWTSTALIEEGGIDLRDPKLSVTPGGELVLLAGGTTWDRDGKYVKKRTRVSFSKDGRVWKPFQPVARDEHWLWRVTWHEGKAWGVAYMGGGGSSGPRDGFLYSSSDGVRFELVHRFGLEGMSESTIRFGPGGEMIVLARFEAGDRSGRIGVSRPPYTEWQWHKIGERVGGPNFLVLPDGGMVAGTRFYGDKATTGVARMTPASYTRLLEFPSGGDTSYPGMVWHEGLLWFSYYSSHEGKTSIYLAKIKLP